MVFGRIWNGATDIFDSTPGLLVDMLSSPSTGFVGAGGPIPRVVDVFLTMPEERAESIFSFVQEDILGAPNAAQMAAGEPGDGVLPTIAKYGTAAYYAAFDERERGMISTVATPVLDAWQWTIDELVDRRCRNIEPLSNLAHRQQPLRLTRQQLQVGCRVPPTWGLYGDRIVVKSY